jgi:hypothetical protein
MCAGTPPFCDFDKVESVFAYLKAISLNVSNIEQTRLPSSATL